MNIFWKRFTRNLKLRGSGYFLGWHDDERGRLFWPVYERVNPGRGAVDDLYFRLTRLVQDVVDGRRS